MQLEDLLVGQADDAIGGGLEFCQAVLGQALPPVALAVEGRVTNASTSAPVSLAARASTGLMPVPAPPPRPATMKTTSAPSQRALSLGNCSSASGAAAFRVAAGAQAAQQLAFRGGPSPGRTRRPAMRVGVDRDEALRRATSARSASNRSMTLTPALPTPKILTSECVFSGVGGRRRVLRSGGHGGSHPRFRLPFGRIGRKCS